MIENNEKDSKILFYKIQSNTSALLTELSYQYTLHKRELLLKHEEVLEYLKKHSSEPLSVNLDEIYQLINHDAKAKPYNIYISDENLIIKNTTYKQDLGFNLSFAKEGFSEHFDKNITGICSPLFEKSSKKFISYSDSYLDKNKTSLLQVSYFYNSAKDKLLNIQKIISNHPNIKNANAYNILDNGYINHIILKDFTAYKTDAKEILSSKSNASKIHNKLANTELIINDFTKDGTAYKSIILSTTSSIADNTKIVYSILLDNSQLQNKLLNLNLIIFIVFILGVSSIVISTRLKNKEIRLNQQDTFVQSSMHEIKTPISIITLNNELRELEFGEDEYSLEITSAIKLLQSSYSDMSFTITSDNMSYKKTNINLSKALNARVKYFLSIAKSKSKTISLNIDSQCNVFISQTELTRLIDNNILNAIKYSLNNSNIQVELKENILLFHNFGNPIKNTKKIFNKYYRENTTIGGHGLGLNIISNICKKYKIDIGLNSTQEKGTTFTYKLKCHTIDISKE